MGYYIFKLNAGEPKVTGIRSGTGQAWFDETFWANNKQIKSFMWPEDRNDLRYLSGIQPEFCLDLLGVPMHRNAKLTDIIYLSSLLNGYIVSSKFRELLEKCNLPMHRFYQVTFHQPDKKTLEIRKINDYWYLYFEKETGEKTVNFYFSEFDTSFQIKYLNMKENELHINTYEEYMNIYYSGHPALRSRKLMFNKKFDKNLDLWGCRFLSVENYISESFYKNILENEITGTRVISLDRAKEISKITGDVFCDLIFD